MSDTPTPPPSSTPSGSDEKPSWMAPVPVIVALVLCWPAGLYMAYATYQAIRKDNAPVPPWLQKVGMGVAGLVALNVLGIFALASSRDEDTPKPEAEPEAAAAAPAEAAPPAPPPPPPTPKTPFDGLYDQAEDYDAFKERLKPNRWAMYSKTSVKECGGIDYAEAPGDDEFAKRDSAAKRDGLRSEYVGRLFRWKASGTLNAESEGFGTKELGEYGRTFAVSRSNYDFKKHLYTFVIGQPAGGGGVRLGDELTIPGPDPMWKKDSSTSVYNKRIGTLGGKALEVEAVQEDIWYVDAGSYTIKWPIDEAVAREVTQSQDLSLELVFRYDGQGLHTACKNVCSTFWGERVCNNENHGGGSYVRSTLRGLRLTTGSTVIHEYIAKD